MSSIEMSVSSLEWLNKIAILLLLVNKVEMYIIIYLATSSGYRKRSSGFA